MYVKPRQLAVKGLMGYCEIICYLFSRTIFRLTI